MTHPAYELLYAHWTGAAACRGDNEKHLRNWFAPIGSKQHAAAQVVCWTMCPVRHECLVFSCESVEPHGIWGGYNAADRRKGKYDPQQIESNPPSQPTRPWTVVLGDFSEEGE